MKKSQLRQIIKEELSKVTNETNSPVNALYQYIKYSMDNGDSKANVLQALEDYVQDALYYYEEEQWAGEVDDN